MKFERVPTTDVEINGSALPRNHSGSSVGGARASGEVHRYSHTARSKPAPMPLEEALKRADPTGRHHRKIAFVVLFAALAGGAAGATSPFLLAPLETQLSLSPALSGALASAVFIGMWIGSFVGGVLCDWLGPGFIMMWGVVLQVIGGSMPAMLGTAIGTIVGFRIVLGFGVVICYQGGNTYLAEWLPTEVRAKYMSLLHFTISVGALLTTFIAAVVPEEEWRWLLALNAIPGFVCTAAMSCFVTTHESPRWQLLNGREHECVDMLHRVQSGICSSTGRVEAILQLPERLCLTCLLYTSPSPRDRG